MTPHSPRRNAWMQFWMPLDSGLDLAIVRIIVAVGMLLFFLPSLDDQLAYLATHTQFKSPRFLVSLAREFIPDAQLRSPGFVTLVWSVATLAALTTALGLFTRTSAVALFLSYGYMISHRYSYGEMHHPETHLLIFLMLLPMAPSGMRLSVDAWRRRKREGSDPPPTHFAVWILRLSALIIGLCYLDAAYAKLTRAGLGWANGYTLQYHTLTQALTHDLSIGLWLADQHWILRLTSYYVLAVEGLFIVAVFWRTAAPFFLLSGMGLHLGLHFVRGGHFDFLSWVMLYSVFIPFEDISKMPRVQRWWARIAERIPGRTSS